MFPSVSPGAIGEGIAYLVVGNRDSVVSGEQVAPVIVAVSVVDGINGFAQFPCGIGILRPCLNVSGAVVSPDPGLVCGLVVLTDELTGRVADIAPVPTCLTAGGLCCGLFLLYQLRKRRAE